MPGCWRSLIVGPWNRRLSGLRFAVAGPYLSFREIAEMVARVSGRPWRIIRLGDRWQRPLTGFADLIDRTLGGRWLAASAAIVAGGFLRLHVSGARADSAFGLVHPEPFDTIRDTLEDAKKAGRAPWLRRLGRPGPASMPESP